MSTTTFPGVPVCDIQPGQRVMHEKYGAATVNKVRRNASNSEWICVCEWDEPIPPSGGRQTIVIKVPGADDVVKNAPRTESRILRPWLTIIE
jgi:hypothetical protein